MTTQLKEQTNSLRFSTDKIVGKEHIFVKIRLDDECKNGHQDFSITGDIYEAGKPKIDRYFISGGCIHHDILKHFPEFDIFIRLHLADYEGIPMYAVENGFYHLREGFSKTPTSSPEFAKEFKEYYRLTDSQYKHLSKSRNKLQYALNLQKLGILDSWKEEAKAAIQYLQQLTGKSFLVDSVKSQYNAPTPEEIQEEEEKVKNGFYTPEAMAQREEAKRQKEFDKLKAEFDKKVEKAQIEYDVKKEVLTVGGSKALHNIIFYNHSKTLSFNWRGYDMMNEKEVDSIMAALKLPEGVKVINAKGK